MIFAIVAVGWQSGWRVSWREDSAKFSRIVCNSWFRIFKNIGSCFCASHPSRRTIARWTVSTQSSFFTLHQQCHSSPSSTPQHIFSSYYTCFCLPASCLCILQTVNHYTINTNSSKLNSNCYLWLDPPAHPLLEVCTCWCSTNPLNYFLRFCTSWLELSA